MTIATSSVERREYQAALEGAVFYSYENGGFLRIAGSDAIDFLNRQTSNDVRLLGPGSVVRTVLTSPTARILDVLTLIPEEESIGAITLPGRQTKTHGYLRGKIFFMDQVTVQDMSDAWEQIALGGPAAARVLSELGAQVPQEIDTLGTLPQAGQSLPLLRVPTFAADTWLLLVPGDMAPELHEALREAGAVRLSPAVYHVLRVEQGLPAADRELTDGYTPLEAGLTALISESKGCYTGQEVIARQLTYDKVTRHLVGLRSAEEMAAGSEVRVGKQTIGMVTSAAFSPRLGHLALAYLKRPYHEPGTAVRVGQEEASVTATVSSLPFSSSSH